MAHPPFWKKHQAACEKQLYLNNQLPKYNNFGVYLHIIWVKEVNSDEIELTGCVVCKILTFMGLPRWPPIKLKA